MREEKRWCGDNAGTPAPPLVGKKKEEKTAERRGGRRRRIQPNRSSERREGGRGGVYVRERGGWGMVKKTDYLSNYYYHFTTSCPLSAHCFILCSLSPLWVMSGSNWWVLLTFSSSSFQRVCVCACPMFPLRLCTLQYSFVFDPTQKALLTMFCYVMWQIGPTLSEKRI